MVTAPNPLWNELAARANVSLSDHQHAQLRKYLQLLFTANERMNLTRITEPAAAELLHIADALTLLPQLPPGPHRLADVGSGGGVPGIVLAIARPNASVMLIESTQKKAVFLFEAARDLGLANVTVEPIRAEAAGLNDMRETFDVAVARAVAKMNWLVEWLLPLVKPGGVMLAMKGQKAREELPEAASAIAKLGGGPALSIDANLAGQDHHVIIRIPKLRPTHPRFPRLQHKNIPLS
ncbi:MAG: 16S rRNA (guanine(527)-N(7))-methyltransferase RsmG [Planctomycetota bacterium]|nr:16S rRNA (guanine(527)-N(7))-methyltransferase RsmG [Planctomycetota bacterium]